MSEIEEPVEQPEEPAVEDQPAKPKVRWGRRILWMTLTLFLGLVSGAGVGLYVIWRGAQYEDLQSLEDYRPKLYTKIYDRNGVFLTPISSEKRIVLMFEDIPTDFVNAMVALEDKDFFNHIGVSPVGILVAVKDNLLKDTMRGASTLTQQLVKNITKDKRASVSRKLKEQFLAVQLESRFTKQEIFAMYTNEVPFGNNQFGIESAANYYFGKSVGQLSLVECATLAGLPQAPSWFNPYRNPERAITKRNLVLQRMWEEGYIEKDVYQAAIKEPMLLYDRKREQPQQVAAHFIDKVRQYLFDTYGEETVRTSAWDVYTTIDIRYQQIAEDAVRTSLKAKDKELGYRPYDALSVFTAGEEKDLSLLDSYFDPTWHRTLQPGINVRALVMEVDEKEMVVRIADHRITLDLSSFVWIGKIKDLNKYFKVGDVPEFTLHPLEDKPVDETAEVEPEVTEETVAEGEEVNPEEAVAGTEGEEPVESEPEPEPFPYYLVLDQEPEIEGAFMAIDVTSGDILAMVGGYDHRRSKFNRAEQAKRQVGSSIKPVIFGAALEQGYTLSDLLFDEPTMFWDPTQFRFDDNGVLEVITTSQRQARRYRLGLDEKPVPYLPHNYYPTFDGKITLRQALAKSTNVVAVKLLNSVGYDHVLEYAHRLKLGHNDLQPFPSLALGAPEISLADMTHAYGTFANEGVRYEPRFIRSIMDAKGFYVENNPKKGEQVISPQNAYMVTSAMKEVIHGRKGTATGARRLGLKHIAGKTGTTNDYTNAWFIGYNKQIAAGAWVGRDLNHTIGRGATGGNTALPIWMEFFKGIKKDLVDEPFQLPVGLTIRPVDYYSGKKFTKDCDCNEKDMILEVFVKGTEPTEICTSEERKILDRPWYLQKRSYQVLGDQHRIKPALVEINYPSQRRALKFLEQAKQGNLPQN